MWSLADGLVGILNGDSGVLSDLRTGAHHRLDGTDCAVLRGLALGAQSRAELPFMSALVAQGWARERDDGDIDDPVLRQRLAVLDRRFRWCAPSGLSRVHQAISIAHGRRRLFNHGFGQYAALPETVLRRVALAGETTKDILVLGDDDMLSVGLRWAGHRVVTIEIDQYLVDVLNRSCGDGSGSEIHVQDLRDPLPEPMHGRFDLFFADPMSGEAMLSLVLSRGLAGINPDGCGYVCVSEAGHESFERVRRAMRFEVREHMSDFNHYYTPNLELSAYTSDLFCVQSGADTVLKTAADEHSFARNLLHEDTLRSTRVGSWSLFGIDVDRAQPRHIAKVIALLKDTGHLRPIKEFKTHCGAWHSYLALTEHGSCFYIRVHTAPRIAELFVAPRQDRLEASAVACLTSILGIQGVVVQKHRTRNVTTQRLY